MISSRLDVHTEIRDARCSRSFCNASTDSDEVSKVIRDLVGPAASLDVVSYAPEAEESYPTAAQQERTRSERFHRTARSWSFPSAVVCRGDVQICHTRWKYRAVPSVFGRQS
jgi:hypothetical protein